MSDDSPKPLMGEDRSRLKRKVDKEARKTAGRLGATGCVVIAFFDAGGGYFHILDGGSAPMPSKELYTNLLRTIEKLEMSGGEDVSVQ